MPQQLKAVENSHHAQGYPESPYTHEHVCYHFFVGTDGTVKQLRGVLEKPGCTRNEEVNDSAIQIVLAGDFSTEEPSRPQLASLKSLVNSLRKRFGIGKDHVIPHKAASPTACPGSHLIEMLWK